MKAYLANGLFSMADIMFNEVVASRIEEAFPRIDLYVPQRNLDINDKSAYADSQLIANGDDSHLNNADFVIAVLDGVEIDSGVACEIGVAATLGKPVFGLCTDTRQLGTDNELKIEALKKDPIENQFVYRNLYVIGKVKNSGGKVVSNIDALIDSIKETFC